MARADLVARFRQARRDPGLVVIEGLHALKHAMRFGAMIETALSPDPAALSTLAGALAPDVAAAIDRSVTPCSADIFAVLAPVAPATGVIALARRPHVDVDAVLAPTCRPLVLLEQPRHLGNLGAAVRVAAAAGAAGLLVVGTADPWHPMAVRGAAGLQFALPCARLDALPASARPLVVLDAEGEPLLPGNLPEGAIVACGTERSGVGPGLRARADRLMAIPMRAGVSSLNLATAVAVALYLGGRRREPSAATAAARI